MCLKTGKWRQIGQLLAKGRESLWFIRCTPPESPHQSGYFQRPVRYARSTDQDGPDLADLLDAFREMVPDSIEFEHERIIRSEADKKNKIQAMVIALSRLIERDSEHLPSTYQISETIHITDQAVADLVSVLFDFDDVSDVKTIRNRAGVAIISKKK